MEIILPPGKTLLGSVHWHNPQHSRYSLIVPWQGRQRWLAGDGDPATFKYKVNLEMWEGRFSPENYRRRRPRSTPAGLLAVAHPQALPPDPTVADLVAEWLRGKHSTVRTTTFRRYQFIAEHLCRASLGDRKAERLTPSEVEAYREASLSSGGRRGRPMRPKTVKEQVVALRAAYNRGQRLGRVSHNPFTVLRLSDHEPDPLLPRVEPANIVVVAEADLPRLLAAVEGTYLAEPTWLGLDCGLRLGEALGLAWGDVDFAARQLIVTWQLGRKGEGRRPTKRSGSRSVPLSSPVAGALRQSLRLHADGCHRDAHAECLIFVGTPRDAADPPHEVSMAFSGLMNRIGLPDITFHRLRHTFATRQIMAGINARTLARWMGHKDPAFTLRIYTHWFEKVSQVG